MCLWAVCWIGVIAGFLFVCHCGLFVGLVWLRAFFSYVMSWTILGLRRMHTRRHSWTILGLSLRRMHTRTTDTLLDNFGPQTDRHTHTQTHSYSLSHLILAKHCQRSFWVGVWPQTYPHNFTRFSDHGLYRLSRLSWPSKFPPPFFARSRASATPLKSRCRPKRVYGGVTNWSSDCAREKNPLFAAKPRFRELWGKEKKEEEEEERRKRRGWGR